MGDKNMRVFGYPKSDKYLEYLNIMTKKILSGS
jgi:hypothetical protein